MAIGLIQLKQIQGLGQIDSNTDPTFNSVTIEQDGIGANLSDGVILSNLQPADSINTIQYSPLLRLTGTAWDNSGSEQDDWIIVNEPVNGSGITTSNLIIASQINGGGYNTQLTLTSSGVLSAITLNLTNSLGVIYGGTSLSSYTKGDIIYASNTNVLSKLGIGTNGQILWIASGIPAWTAQTSITSLGTVTVGTWNATVIGGTYGGTGINNGSYTITLGGNISTGGALTFSGAYSTTITLTGATTVTLPTSGTLVNTSVTTLSSLVSIGTITTGVWNAGTVTTTVNSIGSSSYTSGVITQNTTAAALGAQQYSPLLTQIGQGWNNSSNVSQQVAFFWRLEPIQGNPVTANLTLYGQIPGNNSGNPLQLIQFQMRSGFSQLAGFNTYAGPVIQGQAGGTGIQTNSSGLGGAMIYLASAGASAFSQLAIGSTNAILTVSGGIPAWTLTPTFTSLILTSTITVSGGASLITTSSNLTDGAGSSVGTLTTAPSAGNPTKWIGINDNGTTRYIPAW